MNHHALLPFLIGICMTLWLPQAAAELCDARLTPVHKPTLSYKMRDNRCEGMYRANVSHSSVEVVGLLHGHLDFSTESLTITAPRIDEQVVTIRASGIPLKLYYRLDAELPPGGALEWSLDLLKGQKIGPEQVGLFGRLKDKPQFYVPLYLGSGRPPASAVLLLRATVDVGKILWRYSTAAEDRCRKFGEWRKLESVRGFMAGEAIPFTIPLPDSPQLCLEAALQSRRGNDWLKKLIKIQIQ